MELNHSAQKIKYEAEVQSIKQKYGDVESIRLRLGLSRRRICEELMVDPSAWTRWTQKDGSVPPHVYKTLALLLPKFEASAKLSFIEKSEINILKNEELNSKPEVDLSHIESLRSTIGKLEAQLQSREILSVGWKILLIMNFFLILYVLIR